ncbi:MAG TPA: AAA family ATPase, partial [Candidatus Hodarchaeales archaeon]|nr:AAA family ATPase [Candidatus Hodarchaeales archaeon]
FMFHRGTDLQITRPILLISGANGAGKSQVVEALQIAFGENTSRGKKFGIHSLIHPQAPNGKAGIEVTVNNVGSSPHSHLLFSDLPAIKDLLDSSEVSLRVTITPDKITRAIGSRGIFREIRQRDLRRILGPLGIRPANQLTFTLAETVEVFSQESPYQKFQVLLENLGLQELKDQIVSNEKELADVLRETTRIESRLHDEEKNLELFHQMFEYIQQRSKLEGRREELSLERQWLDAYDLEEQKSRSDQEISSARRLLEEAKHDVEAHRLLISEKKAKVSELRSENENLGQKLRENDRDRDHDRGILGENRGRFKTLESFFESKKGEVERLEIVLGSKGDLKLIEQELSDTQMELEQSRRDLEEVQQQLQQIEESKNVHVNAISRREEQLILDSLKLRRKLEQEMLRQTV